jgi:catalase
MARAPINASLRKSSLALAAALVLCSAHLAGAAETAEPAAAPAKSLPEQIVDTLDVLSSGPHAGYRANHAKGVVVTGHFVPSRSARSLTVAPQFQGQKVPVIVRFSDTTGVPNIPDANPNASPHGIAIRFELPQGVNTDIVSISTNGFPAATPEEFAGLLSAIAATHADTPKPTPIEQFLGSHPKALAFVKMPKPAPVSFAHLTFYGLNAFKFTNRAGTTRYGRYRIIPLAGDKRLTEEQAQSMPPNYLMDDLPARLAKGPVKFRLAVQLAEPGDPLNDGTEVWPDERKQIELGTLVLDKAVADSAAEEKQLAFNPLLLTEGIAPSDDPVLQFRPVVYAVSYGRRVGK